MRDYSSLRRKKNSTLFTIVALALCVTVSAALLFSRLTGFSAMDTQQIIPLTESNGITKVKAYQRDSAQAGNPSVRLLSERIVLLENEETEPATPGFEAGDENTVWEGRTDVEVFRVSYENGEGQVTVNSHNGEKVIAPGTENEYIFTLKNTGNVGLDYTLEMEAYFSDGEKIIPVVARVVDYEGNYLVGSADSFADVLTLNSVSEAGSLSAGYIAPYTLQWQWPFEGDDEYDTWLGNMAADEDITLTIVIRTTAEYGGEGGIPETGDSNGVVFAGAVLAVSCVGLVVMLVPKRKPEEDNGQS